MRQPRKRARIRSRAKFTSSLYYETLEHRQVLSAYFPAFANGEFTLGDPTADSPYQLNQTFFLESNPGASKTIFLDFDGHHSVDNSWNHNIQFPEFDIDGNAGFSTAELTLIQRMFQNVSEDFLPFDVNVTTRDPGVAALSRSSFFDQTYGIRVLNTQSTDGFGEGTGGVAFVNSFRSFADNPAFVFNKGVNAGSQTNSHEAGHALGLRHDGLDNREYHPGTGSGETSWGPILGAPFQSNLSQWSNGDYDGATNTEDDLSIITSNGFGFRDDDHGSTVATASVLELNDESRPFDWGIIEQSSDRDIFQFTTSGGNVRINVDAFAENPNLDVLARLVLADGSVVAASNPISGVDASFNVNLEQGTYYVTVEGTGREGRYSDYGSLGFYTITGDIPGADQTATENAIGESGRVSINHRWATIQLEQNYQDPVVVAGPASRIGGDPVTVRVRNVTENSFQIRIDEWEYRDGSHIAEWVDYLVVEAGTHRLEDGTLLQAGNQSNQTQRWGDYSFDSTFSGTTAPVVLTQAVTTNEDVAISNRVRNVTQSGFELRLQEEQAADGVHAGETVSWIAIETGTTANGDGILEAFSTGDAVSHRDYELEFTNDFDGAPAFIAGLQTTNGGDNATLRYRSLLEDTATIYVEEERSADTEIGHNAESVGYVALEIGLLYGRSQGNSPLSAPTTPAEALDADANGLSYDQWHDLMFSSTSRDNYELVVGLPGHPPGEDHDHDPDHDDDGDLEHDHEDHDEHDHDGHDHDHDEDHDHDHDHDDDHDHDEEDDLAEDEHPDELDMRLALNPIEQFNMIDRVFGATRIAGFFDQLAGADDFESLSDSVAVIESTFEDFASQIRLLNRDSNADPSDASDNDEPELQDELHDGFETEWGRLI